MRYRLVGTHAESVGLALRLKQEGHDVSFFVKDAEAKNVYQGIVQRVKEPLEGIDKSTVIIFDTVKFGKQADALKKAGHKVYGGSQIADDLELDRSFGILVAEVTGESESLDELWSDIYDKAYELQIPNKFYRTDAMENAKDRIEELEAFDDDSE